MKTDILASFPAMMANVREKEPIVQAMTAPISFWQQGLLPLWLTKWRKWQKWLLWYRVL